MRCADDRGGRAPGLARMVLCRAREPPRAREPNGTVSHRALTPWIVAALALPLAACAARPPDLAFGPPERPALLALPLLHDGTTPLPLLVLLHGYGASARSQNAYFGLDAVTRDRGVYLLLPESSRDALGASFWNATDACCDFYGSNVDDVAALDVLLDEVIAALPIDTARIYLLGHSNGGFMAYRMACERGSRFAGVGVLAAADFQDPAACAPTAPVSVLHLHGDADGTIPYLGGSVFAGTPPFPSARASVERWAGYAGCDPTPTAGPARDLTLERPDHPDALETEVLDFTGCAPGLGVSLWTLRDEGHAPLFHRDAFVPVLDWLLEHHR